MRLRTAGCLLLVAVNLLARQPIHSHNAMVVAQEPLAADVGLAVLKSGGNAIDAAGWGGVGLAASDPSGRQNWGGRFSFRGPSPWPHTFHPFPESGPRLK